MKTAEVRFDKETVFIYLHKAWRNTAVLLFCRSAAACDPALSVTNPFHPYQPRIESALSAKADGPIDFTNIRKIPSPLSFVGKVWARKINLLLKSWKGFLSIRIPPVRRSRRAMIEVSNGK